MNMLILYFLCIGLIGIVGCVVVMVYYDDYVRGLVFYLSFEVFCCVIF